VRGGSLGPLLVWLLVGAHILFRQVRDLPADSAESAESSAPVLG